MRHGAPDQCLVLASLLLLIPIALAAAPASPPPMVDVPLSVRPLDLTRPPTTPELMAAGQLGGPLHPTRELRDKARERRINLDFGRAIQAWNDHAYPRAVKLFRQHLEKFPDSPWAAEAKLHIGCDAQYQGRYHEARAVYEGLISEHKGSAYPGARMIANKARLRLGGLEVLQYDFAAATVQFRILKAESSDWRHRTYAAHWIQRLARYRGNESALLTCGTQALAHVLEVQGKGVPARALRGEIRGAKNGQSLAELVRLADRYGQRVQARRMEAADLARVPLPAIVHLEGSASAKSGHYWVVEEARGETLRLYDPQSGRRFRQSASEFAREWGGFALVASNRADLPGTPLEELAQSGTRGGCCGAPMREDDLGDDGPDGPCAPVWRVNMINMNFFAVDTPMWFTPPYGPEVRIRLSYNSQSAIAYHEPFGPKWQFNYATYMVIDTGGTVTIFMPDGRRDVYTPNGAGGFTPPYTVHDELLAVGPDRYELRRVDGTVHVYSMPRVAGGGLVTQLFLEALRDRRGLALTFSYDTDGRLVSITDAPGRVTTLSYNAAGSSRASPTPSDGPPTSSTTRTGTSPASRTWAAMRRASATTKIATSPVSTARGAAGSSARSRRTGSPSGRMPTPRPGSRCGRTTASPSRTRSATRTSTSTTGVASPSTGAAGTAGTSARATTSRGGLSRSIPTTPRPRERATCRS